MITCFNPKVSVCIPTFNGSNFIEACLHSLVNQKSIDLEIVIRDDLSSDRTYQIAKNFSVDYPNINWKICRNNQRFGLVDNWNACLSLCEGDYIKLIGQDDLIFDELCLYKQSEVLFENDDVGLCACNAWILNKSGKKLFLRKKGWKNGKISREKIIKKFISHSCNPLGEPVCVMFRRGSYDEILFDRKYKYFVDVDKWLQINRLYQFSFYLENGFVGFRLHKGSVSFKSQIKTIIEYFDILSKYELKVRKYYIRNVFFLLRDIIVRYIFYYIFG